MASLKQQVQKHFSISDKEWSRMSKELKTKKANRMMDDFRNDANAMADERRKNTLSDLQRSTYGDRSLSNRKVRDTLNKAGYNVKQNTTAAERFKKRYGPVSK